MTSKEFFKLLNKNHLIGDIWEYILELAGEEINSDPHKDDLLKLFAVYFSLIDDGNICMSLDRARLLSKWTQKVEAAVVLHKDDESIDTAELEAILSETEAAAAEASGLLTASDHPQLVGKNRMFDIEDNWLYVQKFSVARKGILSAAEGLFSTVFGQASTFDCKACIKDSFTLSKGQEKAVAEGFSRNLIITGGPGTGKTTSIMFLLLNLLSESTDYELHLVAPSGKAAGRMRESIISGLSLLDPAYTAANRHIVSIIEKLEESTIHRLLGYDFETGGYLYNKDHQFAANSIFIVDEASMIDVCLFNALLQSVHPESRLFIMGDRNQLPSVDCGAVFGDLLSSPRLKGNIVELDESIRFNASTDIYKLAAAVNSGSSLPVAADDWKGYDSFAIQADNERKPVFYYKDSKADVKEKDIVESLVKTWGNEYFKCLQSAATDIDGADTAYLKELSDLSELGKILSAENDGPRGVNTINRLVKKLFVDQSAPSSIGGYYPGQLVMITRNNRPLDLYNGDSGILVTFKDDPTLYFMVKKESAVVSTSGKQNGKLFKLGRYMFYPLHMISAADLTLSYAITIHKAQGSDYRNILVILPAKQGHPLLNRQIVYTAITRTKGNTYILSNQERLEEATDRCIDRDTNITI